MARKKVKHDWSEVKPRFTKSRIAWALELKVAGKSLREIQKRTGVHYTYLCKLSKQIADPRPPKQLESERARTAAVVLLTREKEALEARLLEVNAGLFRYTGEVNIVPAGAMTAPAVDITNEGKHA